MRPETAAGPNARFADREPQCDQPMVRASGPNRSYRPPAPPSVVAAPFGAKGRAPRPGIARKLATMRPDVRTAVEAHPAVHDADREPRHPAVRRPAAGVRHRRVRRSSVRTHLPDADERLPRRGGLRVRPHVRRRRAVGPERPRGRWHATSRSGGGPCGWTIHGSSWTRRVGRCPSLSGSSSACSGSTSSCACDRPTPPDPTERGRMMRPMASGSRDATAPLRAPWMLALAMVIPRRRTRAAARPARARPRLGAPSQPLLARARHRGRQRRPRLR